MAQSFYGSICLTDLIEQAQKKHSSFVKAKNDKIYCNITEWLNDEEDKYHNIMAIQANPTKEKKDKEERFYLGNCKKSEKIEKPLDASDVKKLEVDLPVSSEAGDDLPF